MPDLAKFRALGLSNEALKVLELKGFEEPSPIQEKTIPLILNEKSDLIAQAQTGTGKTAAFGIPLLELIRKPKDTVQALILVPTRELAIQVAEELNSLRVNKQLQIIPIYGGQSMQEQLRRLKKGRDIIVATPGRLIDHLERKSIDLKTLDYVVLDEADEMLRMGFIEDVESILQSCPKERRTLLFSATMPPPILKITDKYMRDKKLVSIEKTALNSSLTDQIYFEVKRSDRFDALCRIIDFEDEFYAVIFCRTKLDVDDLAKQLLGRGYTVEALHGDVSQNIREVRLRQFKEKKANILVATDVAARGIDVNNLTHVINYSLPQSAETYVHRIGRTGRAGKQGVAITFITPSEFRNLTMIKRITKTDIRKGNLPKMQDIIKHKVKQVAQRVDGTIKDGLQPVFTNLAKDLLAKNSAEQVLAALLQQSMQMEFGKFDDRDSHDNRGGRERQEHNSNTVDQSGTTRLFVSLGKKDQVSPKKLIALLGKNVRIEPRRIKEIEIFDTFSFVTVPFKEAEIILNASRKEAKGKRQLIEKAR